MNQLQGIRSLPRSSPNRAYRTGLVRLVLLVWIALVTAGFSALVVYERYPGTDGGPTLKAESTLHRETWTLLVAVHPRCPCTQATVDELESLLRRYPADVVCHAMVYHPPGLEKVWLELSLVEQLRALPRVTLSGDSDGRKLAALGMETSGAVRLIDPAGKVRFYGGITASRGHRGFNAGSQIIESLLRGKAITLDHAPVYGCRMRPAPKEIQ